MANLRIVYDNAANRATVTASSTAGSLVASNLLTDLKGQVHRSVGTSVTYTLAWPSGAESVGCVALPACNLTKDATIRVRGYSAVSAGTLLVDSGVQLACPGQTVDMWDWPQPLNSKAFAYGGYSKCIVWLDDYYALSRAEIIITDTTNAAGYIDSARVVAGAYWSPAHGAAYGASNDIIDNSKTARSDAGDLVTDRFSLNETMNINLENMHAADRAYMNQIMRSCGIHKPLLISLVPEADDPYLQQDTLIYGKRENSPITFKSFDSYGSSLTIGGW